MICVLAIDVGGTTVKGSIVEASGRCGPVLRRPTKHGDAALAVVHDLLGELAAAAAADGLGVLAAGVVTPGVVDAKAGRVEHATNLGWHDVALGDDLAEYLGVPVAVDHAARAAGVAESLIGAARAASESVFIPIGTGIAAAIVREGQAFAGATNWAGEAGHMPVHPRGEACACGQRGCLETYASAGAIARRYREFGGVRADSAAAVAALLGRDPVADRVWADAAEALALACATLTLTLDPELFVLGGGLAQAGETLLAPVRAGLSDLLAWRAAPRIVPAQLGVDAGRLGAGIVALRAVGQADAVARWAHPALSLVPPL